MLSSRGHCPSAIQTESHFKIWQKPERKSRSFSDPHLHSKTAIGLTINFLSIHQARSLRESFDVAITNGVLIPQIRSLMTRSFFFYESPKDDERLSRLSQTLLNRNKEVLELISKDNSKLWSKPLSSLLIANLRLLHKNGTSLVLPLRLVEIYACPSSSSLWLYLIKLQYFKIIKHLLETRCPEVDEECTKPPTPLAESLLTLLRKPLESCANDEEK